MTHFESIKGARGIRDVFMNRPDKYKQALTLAQELLREPSHLPPLDRELIATYTSFLNGCQYCYGSHKTFCISLGATEEDLDFSNPQHRLKPLLEYVRTLTLSPNLTYPHLRDDVLKAGFTEEELKDAIAVCAIFNFFNRIVEGHGIEANADTWDASAHFINEHGYDRRY